MVEESTNCNSSDPKTDADSADPDKDSATDMDKDIDHPDVIQVWIS